MPRRSASHCTSDSAFRSSTSWRRWEGLAPARRPQPQAAYATADQLTRLQLDQQITGTPRLKLLQHLLRQPPRAMRVAVGVEGLLGYATWREGSRRCVHRTGHVVARGDRAELAEAVLTASGERRVFVDIPCDNEPATHWAQSCGFTVQRPLIRMVRGEPVADRRDCLWASSGPECG